MLSPNPLWQSTILRVAHATRARRFFWVATVALVAVTLIRFEKPAPEFISVIVGVIVLLAVAETLLLAFVSDTESEREIPREMPDGHARRSAYNDRLAALNRAPEPDTALFLLDEAKRRFSAVLDGNKAVEDKARQMLALVAGGSSAVALFAGPQRPDVIELSPTILVALFLTLCSFAALLYVLRVKERHEPSVATFISEPMAADPKYRSVLALSLAEDFEAASLAIYWDRRREPWAMFAAYLCTIGAAFLLTVNAALGISQKPTAHPSSNSRPTLYGPVAMRETVASFRSVLRSDGAYDGEATSCSEEGHSNGLAH